MKTKEQISLNMQHNKGKGTKIETVLQSELWNRGMRYRKNKKGILGHPDITFANRKIAIFCDGEFWHGYDWENRKSDFKSNRDFWIQKIERNIQRDREVTEGLRADGWIVLRYWGKDILSRTSEIADEIETIWRERKPNGKY